MLPAVAAQAVERRADEEAVRAAVQAPAAIHWYLNKVTFPAFMQAQS